ncbi:gluconate 2-dehydrogenase subunit 3 family protein [Sphingomonas sp. TDK1]|uniref:gluconate 2-dehydrogenase subunit 3 family protein n=1 Tax=Sphingomonas sp. TDK1 TaxID=453247 RepID=UPI0007D8F9B3|nr:gluconate 2-dehydrogenase subunit 3 family protein [Sphingomonas sp. TDK1]OAN63158.1 twin-arginine translocation pathway signal protein [Sphingomonas sp. TDK1]
MAERQAAGWSRRDFFGGAALLALAVGIPATVVRYSDLDPSDEPSDRQRAMIARVSQLVIPRTDTAGAGDVGVGDFVILALAHGLEGSRAPVAADAMPNLASYQRRDGSLRHLDWLDTQLDQRAAGDFQKADTGRRVTALQTLDREAFAEGVRLHPWRTIKGLILTGYYTSEIGGSKELNYELVPGRWDPDLPLKATDHAWSSDWTAVDFG